MARHRRHHRRHHFMNPGGSIMADARSLVKPGFIIEAAGVAAGFVLPGVLMNYVPVTWKAAKWQFYAVKVGSILVLSAAGRFVSRRVSNFILVGGAVSLLLDVWTEFMGAGTVAAAPAATAPAAAAYYGGSINAYYGDGMGDFDVP